MTEFSLRRFQEAYMNMAEKVKYRPRAFFEENSEIDLSEEELHQLILKEAHEYAVRFLQEEDERTFDIGCSNGATNRAFVYIIEAARVLCCGLGGEEPAIKLLKMAIRDIESAKIGKL